jgi:catechol-2,3-dioxygenase
MSEFYCQTLCFESGDRYAAAGRRLSGLMGVPDARFEGVFLRRGAFRLELLRYESCEPSRRATRSENGYAHLSFVVADAQATLDAMIRHGASATSSMTQTFDVGLTTLAFCEDPEGNVLELFSHSDSGEIAAHAKFLGMAEADWPL